MSRDIFAANRPKLNVTEGAFKKGHSKLLDIGGPGEI